MINTASLPFHPQNRRESSLFLHCDTGIDALLAWADNILLHNKTWNCSKPTTSWYWPSVNFYLKGNSSSHREQFYWVHAIFISPFWGKKNQCNILRFLLTPELRVQRWWLRLNELMIWHCCCNSAAHLNKCRSLYEAQEYTSTSQAMFCSLEISIKHLNFSHFLKKVCLKL